MAGDSAGGEVGRRGWGWGELLDLLFEVVVLLV